MSISTELQRLHSRAEAEGRRLEREDVLRWARENTESAIWDDFEARGLWNDSTAAELARLAHAGTIIMRYRIVNTEPTQATHLRGFIRREQGRNSKGYELTEKVLEGDERLLTIEAITKRCLSAMSNYFLEELQPIADACQQVLRSVESARASAAAAQVKGRRKRGPREDRPAA